MKQTKPHFLPKNHRDISHTVVHNFQTACLSAFVKGTTVYNFVNNFKSSPGGCTFFYWNTL